MGSFHAHNLSPKSSDTELSVYGNGCVGVCFFIHPQHVRAHINSTRAPEASGYWVNARVSELPTAGSVS